MEDEVCKHGKFGFCKFKQGCKKKHFTEVCENLSRCNNMNECEKRHPKACRRFKAENECRFKKDCAYSHIESWHDQEKNMLKEKIEILENTVKDLSNSISESKKLDQIEKVLHALKRKVLSLEDEFKVMKNKKATDKYKIENCFTKQSSFNIDDIKCSSSTPKDVKEKTKYEIKEDLPTCKVSLFKFCAEVHNNDCVKNH